MVNHSSLSVHSPDHRTSLELSKEASSSVTLKRWATKHKIEKNVGVGVLGHLIRKVGLIAISVFLIAALPFVALFNLGVILKEKYQMKYQPDAILPSIRAMKATEEKDKFTTMQQVLNEMRFANLAVEEQVNYLTKNLAVEEQVNYLTKNLEGRLTDGLDSLIKNRQVRYILRHLSQQVPFNPAWIQALNDPDVVNALIVSDIEWTPQRAVEFIRLHEKYPTLDASQIDRQKIASQLKKNRILSGEVPGKVKQFRRSLTQLLQTLKTTDADFGVSTNQQFIVKLRQLLKSPIYQALKEDSSEPVIQLLHRFASDMWNKAPSTKAYQDLGARIIQETKIKHEQGITITGFEMAQCLADSHPKMEKAHWSTHGLSGLFYSITHPFQILGGLASEGGAVRHIPGMVGRDKYDSHGTLSNNPSLQGITTVEWKDQSNAEQVASSHIGYVHNCYGGSPTIGDHLIAPEFEAAIQAAENNQMAPAELRDPEIPMMVNYNNLQNLDKHHGEGPRSRTIMLLNKKYPLSFRGATFTKDSDLYLMKKKGSVIWTSPKEFGEKMLHQLKRSFNPNEKGHGFYFHGPLSEWEPIFKAAIDQATKHFESQEPHYTQLGLQSSDLQGAYQEYVYSLIQAANEMQALKILSDRKIENPLVMVISACKENIDRGGMENTKYMYTRLPDTYQEQRLPLIMGVMHSRALSSRDRVILSSRLPQVLNFMKITEPQAYRDSQIEFFKELGYTVDQHAYCPAISSEDKIFS